MTTINAHPNPEDIMAWSDQELDAAAAARVRAHVDDCASCRSVADGLRNVRARADQWRVEPAPSSVRAAVLSAAARDRVAPPTTASGAPRGFWQRYRWQLVAASLVIAAVFVGGQVSLCGEVICRIRQSDPPPAETSIQVPTSIEAQAVWEGGPRVDLGIPADGAAVVVAWVVDYECLACAVYDPLFTMLSLQYATSNPGQVKFVVEDWPWNAECNPNVPTLRGHEASCTAAVAMRLAEARGTAAALQTWLFRHQPATSAEVGEAAASIGKITGFDAQYPAELAALRARLTALAPAGIHSTPTCFVNGMLVNDATGHVSVPMVKMAIASELAKAGKK